MRKIVSCKIGPYPKNMFGPMMMVSVGLDNGYGKDLFKFYPDERSFHASDFIGKTEEEAHRLTRALILSAYTERRAKSYLDWTKYGKYIKRRGMAVQAIRPQL